MQPANLTRGSLVDQQRSEERTKEAQPPKGPEGSKTERQAQALKRVKTFKYKKLAQTFKDTQCLENTLEYAVEGLNADHNGILRLMKSGQLFDWDKVVEHKTENPFYRLLRTGSNNMNA